MKKLFPIFLSIMFILLATGCSSETSGSRNLSSNSCVNCGKSATHLAGTEFDIDTYQTVYLYYCDSCYSDYVGDYEDRFGELEDAFE